MLVECFNYAIWSKKLDFFQKYKLRYSPTLSNTRVCGAMRSHLLVDGIPGPEVINLFSCSTQLSTKFQLHIKA